MSLRSSLRARLKRPGGELVIAPLVTDPFTAILAQRAGFDTVYLGGGSMGYVLGISEALLTADDMSAATKRICDRLEVAVVVDGGVGFGDAVHTARAVRLIEQAGACGIEIEDQVAPKRAHHHKGVEHLVSTEEMQGKIKAGLEARRDDDFLIIARCNAPQIEGVERAIERAQAYQDAGAHLVMMRCRTEEEFARFSAGISAALSTLASWMVKPDAEMEAAGYRLILDPNSVTVLTYKALTEGYAAMKAGGRAAYGLPREETTATMAQVMQAVDLEALYAIEAATTEKATLADLQKQDGPAGNSRR